MTLLHASIIMHLHSPEVVAMALCAVAAVAWARVFSLAPVRR
jgi:hypothetical protein